MKEKQALLKDWIRCSNNIVFFGGAGVSTASGIPDFRSAHGLYSGKQGHKYEEMLSSNFFHNNPDEFWRFYRSVMLYPAAKPNPAHYALFQLEKIGKLSAIVTQNIDGLHQAAGSKRVIELHGTEQYNHCVQCGKIYTLSALDSLAQTPYCSCGGLIKPNIVLYGEALDENVVENAISQIENCDLLIVGGTSLAVQPAASFIEYRRPQAKLVLINHEATAYDVEADLIIRESIADVMWQAIDTED